MGYVNVRVEASNPATPEMTEGIDLLVDTGAMLSVLPRPLLQRLGIQPVGTRRFRIFGGRIVERQIGAALFHYQDAIAAATVIFGDEGDQPIMGVTTLETLGYQVDPVTGELKAIELLQL